MIDLDDSRKLWATDPITRLHADEISRLLDKSLKVLLSRCASSDDIAVRELYMKHIMYKEILKMLKGKK